MHPPILALSELLLNGWHKSKGNPAHCFVGFDGFTDEIVVPLTKVHDGKREPFPTMADFTAWLHSMAGKSCNVELEVRTTKMGGNAPILANALIEGGHRMTLAGCLGTKEIEPLFHPLTDRCEEVFTFAASGHSDALEFKDGKIILGKLAHLNQIKALDIVQSIGKDKLTKILDRSKLFVSANWTMLPMMNELWGYIHKEIVPQLSPAKRFLFVDLADPSKRSDTDLRQAFGILQKLNSSFHVIQGLNLAEAERVAKLFNIPLAPMEQLASALQKTLGFKEILIHHPQSACVATEENVESVPTFHTKNPVLTTGAGDNFNAGYCNGLLFNFTPKQALLSAVATAGFYVRKGKSPTIEELAFFLREWDK